MNPNRQNDSADPFRRAAESLATLEIHLRRLQERKIALQKGTVGPFVEKGASPRSLRAELREVEAQIGSLLKQYDRLLARCEDLQEENRELRNRRFWYEVPFDIEDPLPAEKNPKNYPWRNKRWPDGHLLETRRFALVKEKDRWTLSAPSDRVLRETGHPCRDWLDNPRLTEDLILLYMDREAMERWPAAVPLLRGIYDVEEEHFYTEMFSSGGAPIPSFSGRSDYWRAAGQRAWDKRQEQLDNLDRSLNFLSYGIAMDELTKAAFGLVSRDEADYWVLNRTTEYYEMRERFRQLEAQDRFLRHQRLLASRQRSYLEKDQILRFAEVAQAGYLQHSYGDRLVLLFIPIASTSYCEVRCSPRITLDDMNGSVYTARVEDRLYPDSAPLLRFFAEAYAGDLPFYDVMEERPANMRDDQWRIWAEARWQLPARPTPTSGRETSSWASARTPASASPTIRKRQCSIIKRPAAMWRQRLRILRRSGTTAS